MARLGLLHGIHRECANGVDTSPRELGAGVGVTVGRHRGVRAHHSSAGALYVQARLQLEVSREDNDGKDGKDGKEGKREGGKEKKAGPRLGALS